MTKKEVSAVLARASRAEVEAAAEKIKENHEISIVKQPQKTLVMVKVRESVKQSLFYLGEVLASECMVTVDGEKGSSVMAGDDFDKVMAAAVIDGLLNIKSEEVQEEQETVKKQIEELKRAQERERAKLNKALLKSKVNFNVMGE